MRELASTRLQSRLLAAARACRSFSGARSRDQARERPKRHADGRAPDTTTTTPAKPASGPPAKRIRLTAVGALDPEGDNRENDELAVLAVDGDAATAWRTERYTSFFKTGVGLELDAGRPVAMKRVRIQTDDAGIHRRDPRWPDERRAVSSPCGATADPGDDDDPAPRSARPLPRRLGDEAPERDRGRRLRGRARRALTACWTPWSSRDPDDARSPCDRRCRACLVDGRDRPAGARRLADHPGRGPVVVRDARARRARARDRAGEHVPRVSVDRPGGDSLRDLARRSPPVSSCSRSTTPPSRTCCSHRRRRRSSRRCSVGGCSASGSTPAPGWRWGWREEVLR